VTTLDPLSTALIAFATRRGRVDHPPALRLRGQFDGAILDSSDFRGDLAVTMRPKALISVCRTLRDDPGLKLGLLLDVCEIDYLNRAEHFDVIYHPIRGKAAIVYGRRYQCPDPIRAWIR
jgi:hypothetical protein